LEKFLSQNSSYELFMRWQWSCQDQNKGEKKVEGLNLKLALQVGEGPRRRLNLSLAFRK
jgi:hypothetical protein